MTKPELCLWETPNVSESRRAYTNTVYCAHRSCAGIIWRWIWRFPKAKLVFVKQAYAFFLEIKLESENVSQLSACSIGTVNYCYLHKKYFCKQNGVTWL